MGSIHKMNIGKGIGNLMLHVFINLNFDSCKTFPHLYKHINQMLYSTNAVNNFKRLNVNLFKECNRLLLTYRNLLMHSIFLSATLRLSSTIL